MNNLKISIVTVCYNAVDTIEKTIQSVICQTYEDIEYLIIDGLSKDGTIELISRYSDKLDFVLSEPDKGIYDAMNKGIAKATGDYILFLNSGDSFYDSEVLTKVSNRINGTPSVVFGDVAFMIDGKKYHIKANPFYEHLPLHHDMGFNHQCTFVRAEIAKKYPFDLNYKVAADYNMIITIYKNGGTFQQLKDLIISEYDLYGFSQKNRQLHIFETLMVDSPNREKWNYVYSFWLLQLTRFKIVMRNVLKFIAPNIIEAFRKCSKEKQAIS